MVIGRVGNVSALWPTYFIMAHVYNKEPRKESTLQLYKMWLRIDDAPFTCVSSTHRMQRLRGRLSNLYASKALTLGRLGFCPPCYILVNHKTSSHSQLPVFVPRSDIVRNQMDNDDLWPGLWSGIHSLYSICSFKQCHWVWHYGKPNGQYKTSTP